MLNSTRLVPFYGSDFAVTSLLLLAVFYTLQGEAKIGMTKYWKRNGCDI